jgi:hypothetical protein
MHLSQHPPSSPVSHDKSSKLPLSNHRTPPLHKVPGKAGPGGRPGAQPSPPNALSVLPSPDKAGGRSALRHRHTASQLLNRPRSAATNHKTPPLPMARATPPSARQMAALYIYRPVCWYFATYTLCPHLFPPRIPGRKVDTPICRGVPANDVTARAEDRARPGAL